MAAAALSASSFVAPTRVRVARRPVVQSRGYARAPRVSAARERRLRAPSRAPRVPRPARLRTPRSAAPSPRWHGQDGAASACAFAALRFARAASPTHRSAGALCAPQCPHGGPRRRRLHRLVHQSGARQRRAVNPIRALPVCGRSPPSCPANTALVLRPSAWRRSWWRPPA